MAWSRVDEPKHANLSVDRADVKAFYLLTRTGYPKTTRVVKRKCGDVGASWIMDIRFILLERYAPREEAMLRLTVFMHTNTSVNYFNSIVNLHLLYIVHILRDMRHKLKLHRLLP